MTLNSDQIRRLDSLFNQWIVSGYLPIPAENESEPIYTAQFLLPKIKEFVVTMQRPELLVRGDGGVPPLPLVADGMQFFPDVEVVSGNDRYLAVETKFLKSTDPTGAFSKALGQALIYKSLGFHSVHILLLDIRQQSSKVAGHNQHELVEKCRNVNIGLHWYKVSENLMIHST